MSSFPDEWKRSKIIPIPKSNNEFRPIVILPFLFKVMENLIAKQMNNYLISNNFLSDRQSCFIRARSCTTALVDVVDDLRLKLDEHTLWLLIRLIMKYYWRSYKHFFIFLIQLVVWYVLISWTDHNVFTWTVRSRIRWTLGEIFLRDQY